jgi:curved DNA-binding protein
MPPRNGIVSGETVAVDFKDYYQILGVNRSADTEEIRRAFRKLAREFHPDVASNNKGVAEERFKAINEAYNVLGNSDKRRRYDSMAEDWRRYGSANGKPNPRGHGPGASQNESFDFAGAGFGDFFDSFFEGYRGQPGTRENPSGSPRGRDLEREISVTLEEVVRGSVRQIAVRRVVPCPVCKGSRKGRSGLCPECRGAGQKQSQEKLQLRIPPGIKNGQKLRLSGQGEFSAGYGGTGDLYLRVRLAEHPRFRVEDSDLIHDVALAPWEAVLGAELTVSTLTVPIQVKVPPSTQNGQKLRVKGYGLPTGAGGSGDLLIRVQVEMPRDVSPMERKLWEELSRMSSFRPRA